MNSGKYTAELIGARFKTAPYDHQIREFEEHAEAPARAMSWHMRTGKSKTVIDRACHLYKAGKIDGVLIFAPNGVHAAWIERELPAHCWVPSAPLLWRTSQAGRLRLGANPIDWWKEIATVRKDRRLMWLAMNTESMTRKDTRAAVALFLKYRKTFLVFDESDDFGNPGSKRTKWARALARRCPFRVILSGTIITSSPLLAFSQFELLEKGALGFERYDEFCARYAVYEEGRGAGGRRFPKLVGYQNQDELRERIAGYTSVVLRDECNMPALVSSIRRIKPTQEQLEVYRELHESFRVDIAEERVSVGERAPRFRKLQQVFSGFVIDEHRIVKWIPGSSPRLDALSEEVYLAPGKVIVWCQFQADIDAVVKRLLTDGHKVAEYHGRVSDKAKAQALSAFTEKKEIKPLVGHPQSAGRGLNMSVASTIIWYSYPFSARIYQQAMERATQIGGKNISVIHFEAPGPDGAIRKLIGNRTDIADAIAGRGLRDFLDGISV